jgi:hypothetical protein
MMNKEILRLFMKVVFLGLFSGSAIRGSPQLFDIENNPISDIKSLVDWPLIPYTPTSKYKGVIKIGGCTGSLIKTWKGAVPPPSASTFIVTGGHCTGEWKAEQGEIHVSRNFTEQVRLNPFFDAPNVESSLRVPSRLLCFSTMNLTDLAIVELRYTASDLMSNGYPFYEFASVLPESGSDAVLIGGPGVPTPDGKLRAASGKFGDIWEGYESWGHYLSRGISHTCSSFSGSSGSPIFDSKGKIGSIAVQSGILFNVGMRVHDIPACFTDVGLFEYMRPGCLKGWKEDFMERFGVDPPLTGYDAVDLGMIRMSATESGSDAIHPFHLLHACLFFVYIML